MTYRLSILATLLFISRSLLAASPHQVDQAVQKAVGFLYSQQNKSGTWETNEDPNLGPQGKHRGGLTAVAVYALIAAGENAQDARLARAIDFLKNADMPSAYAVGNRAQIWPLLPPSPETKKLARRDAEILIKQIKQEGEARGLFYYPQTPPDKYDMSISQYGVLALWAADQLGAEVGMKHWEEMDRAWRGKQHKDGGWAYINNSPQAPEAMATPSMTAAGIATLFITHDYVRASQYLGCAGNREDPNIARGIAWITKNFEKTFDENIRGPGIPYYTLYGIERIGVAGGFKYFGKIDWFEAGSNFLVEKQNKDGSWGSGQGNIFGHNVNNIPTTSFGLLFLARGRSPVIVSKLAYEPASKNVEGAWNQRPRDVANLTQWIGRTLETPLNWQITHLSAPVDELLESPVLYIAGSHPIDLTDEHEKKLRQFVQEGGLIVGHADCSQPNFAKTFREMGQKLFGQYEFREIPADHPIWTNQLFHADKLKNKATLQGLSNGSRELMILISQGDPARIWQTPYDGRLDAYASGANILLYAVDKKGLRNRNVTHVVRSKKDAPIEKSIRLARLSYPGNWDPEPGGWRRIRAIVKNSDKIDLLIDKIELGSAKLTTPPEPAVKIDQKKLREDAFKRIPPDKIAATAGDVNKIESLIKSEMTKLEKEINDKHKAAAGRNSPYHIAHITGNHKVKLSDAQIAELKNFVTGGGTLLIDSTGGNTDFADSIDASLTQAFGDAAKQLAQPLAPNHPILEKLPPEVYRRYAMKRLGNTQTPRLRAITIDNRPAVLFSHEDLSIGIVGMEVDGLTGYTPAAATRIVRNIVKIAK